MKHMKSLFSRILITAVAVMIYSGAASGAAVTMQRETASQDGRESAVIKSSLSTAGRKLQSAPRMLREKNDSAMETGNSDRSVSRQRYKLSKKDEGETKIK
jgi:hypothetical protein